jgi:hypothetical protein
VSPRGIALTFSRNLAPGGWAEFQELDLTFRSDDGSLTEDHYLLKWANTITGFLNSINRDCSPGVKVRQWAEDAGFTNVQEQIIKVPIGPWPKDPHFKEVGLINAAQLLDGLEALSLKPLAAVGFSEAETLVLVAKVRDELKKRAFHAYYTM